MKPVLLLGLFIVGCNAFSGAWNSDDTDRLSQSLQIVLKTKKDDISALHYAASTLKLLNVQPATAAAQAACDIAKKADMSNIESVYHAAGLSSALPNCALSTVTGVKETIEAVVKESNPTSAKIYQALSTAEKLAIKVDKAAFDTALTSALKDANTPGLIAGINAATLLDKAISAKYISNIASIISQANVVDNKFLQFDGGLSVTSDAVFGIQTLATQQGKPGFSEKNLALVSNYLINAKNVNTPVTAFSYIRVLDFLAKGQQVPVAVASVGSTAVDLGKNAKIHVSNIFGQAVTVAGKCSIKNFGGKSIAQGIVLKKVDNLHFEIPLDQVKEAGVYDITVDLESQDKKLVGLAGHIIRISLVQDVVVEDLKVGVLDKEDTGDSSLKSVATFSKLGSALQADHTKRIVTKFALKAKNGGSSVSAQQVFVVLTHSSGVEQFFQAKKAGSMFTSDIALTKAHNDWNAPSGKYSVRIVVGDASIKTPINWAYADITLSLPATPVDIVPKTQQIIYEPLQEIKHMFRQPDKRAPAFLSSLFTIACLVPLGFLFVLWLRIGINFGGMPASPYVLIFHSGLAAVFALYGVFWLQLNMFETLKYLAIIGTVTFLAGNRLLKQIADKRKAKTD